MSHIELVTGATTTALTLVQAKAHLIVDSTTHDTVISDLSKACDSWIEKAVRGGVAVRQQTWKLKLDRFPGKWEPHLVDRPRFMDKIRIPRPPLVSITHIKYYNDANTQVTLDSTSYQVSKPKEAQGWVEPAYAANWPGTVTRPDSVEIQFVCGSTAAANIPLNLITAIKLRLADLFENRGDEQPPGKSTQAAVEALASAQDYGFYG